MTAQPEATLTRTQVPRSGRRPRLSGPARDAFVLALLLFLLMVAGIAAPWAAPYDPTAIVFSERVAPPSIAHPFGTDDFGRDILLRILHGTTNTLGLAGASVLLAALLGVALGLTAGYVGGALDGVAMRFVDALLAFPPLLLALTLVTVTGATAPAIVVVLGVTHMPRYARLLRSVVLSLREREFILAARSVGVPGRDIAIRHILPNSAAPMVVYGSLDLGVMVTAVAGLSFLGFGLQPPEETWGRTLAEGRPFLATAPWMSTFPGLAIAATVLTLNLLGDAVRDLLDPRSHHRL